MNYIVLHSHHFLVAFCMYSDDIPLIEHNGDQYYRSVQPSNQYAVQFAQKRSHFHHSRGYLGYFTSDQWHRCAIKLSLCSLRLTPYNVVKINFGRPRCMTFVTKLVTMQHKARYKRCKQLIDSYALMRTYSAAAAVAAFVL